MLLDDCIAFWGGATEDLGPEHPKLKAKIRARMHSINQLLFQLFKNDSIAIEQTKNIWKILHRAASGGNFDDHERKADPNRLTSILKSGWDLRREVVAKRRELKRGLLSG